MHTLQPALKRGRDVWDPINMPATEFRDRVERVRAEMAKRQIDLCLIYGRGSNHYGNPAYLSGSVIAMPRGALVAVPLEKDVTLMAEGFPRDLPALKRTSWIADIRACADVSAEFGKYLAEMKEPPGTVCLAGPKQFMPFQQYRRLTASLASCRLVEDDGFIAGLRMIKSEKEYDQIRRASRLARSAFGFVAEAPLKTMTEKYLEAALDYVCRLEGAEDVRILMGRPRDEYWSLRPAEALDIRDGDRLAVYLAVERERYWAESVRTFQADLNILKPAVPEEMADLFGRIAGRIKPGTPIAEFVAGANLEMEKSRVDALPWQNFGGGIGLSLREYPDLESRSPEIFLDGMCFALNVAAGHPSLGGFMLGETFSLNRGRTENLTAG